MEPPKIEHIQPQQSIYDGTLDLPDFNEREQREHPHVKLYPEPGMTWTLRSSWNIIGASQRGYRHAYDGKYREDDFGIRRFKVPTKDMQPTIVVVVAIADGVSSKPFSRRGARAAVQGALSITNSSVHLQELGKCIGKQASLNQWQAAAYNTLIESLHSAHASVEQRGMQDRIHPDEMHSTLMVYLLSHSINICLLPASRLGTGHCSRCNQQREQRRANDGNGCNTHKFRQQVHCRAVARSGIK